MRATAGARFFGLRGAVNCFTQVARAASAAFERSRKTEGRTNMPPKVTVDSGRWKELVALVVLIVLAVFIARFAWFAFESTVRAEDYARWNSGLPPSRLRDPASGTL